MYEPAKHVDHRLINLQKRKRKIFYALNALLTSCGYWGKACGFVNIFFVYIFAKSCSFTYIGRDWRKVWGWTNQDIDESWIFDMSLYNLSIRKSGMEIAQAVLLTSFNYFRYLKQKINIVVDILLVKTKTSKTVEVSIMLVIIFFVLFVVLLIYHSFRWHFFNRISIWYLHRTNP